MQFYTYVWYDADWIPYYVGKGCGTRCYARRGIPHPEEGHVVLKYFDLEEDAFEHEQQLISFWGRRDFEDNGLLMNKALGGPGSSGVMRSNEHKERLRQSKLAYWSKKTPEERRQVTTPGGKAIAKKTAKKYIVTDPDGQELQVTGLRSFCAARGLNSGSMHRLAKGKQKFHHGYQCRYA